MNNNQQDALLEQALDIRAARTLCREGWSCEQINSVLKNTDITHQQFTTIQAQSRELDKLQKVFAPPIESQQASHTDPTQSDLDFLNRGPDAAISILFEKGWSHHEINFVIIESMFTTMDSPQLALLERSTQSSHNRPATISNTAFASQEHSRYPLGQPHGGAAAVPYPADRLFNRSSSRKSLSRDVLILAFMAAFALTLVFTLL